MLGQGQFYFQTLRKLMGSFGALFNNIIVARYSTNGNTGTILKTIQAPIKYGPMRKWLAVNTEKVEPQANVRFRNHFPKISYQMTGTQYDPKRKLQTLRSLKAQNNTDTTKFLRQLNPVPYDIAMEVNIACLNENDMYQIIESILPNFVPSFNLSVQDIPELGIVKDVPIILASSEPNNEYEGEFNGQQLFTWKLTFVLKAYLYPVITDAGLIKTVITTLYPNATMTDPSTAVITVAVDPTSAEPTDDYTITTTITENTGILPRAVFGLYSDGVSHILLCDGTDYLQFAETD